MLEKLVMESQLLAYGNNKLLLVYFSVKGMETVQITPLRRTLASSP